MVEGWNYSLLSSVCEEITSGGAAPQGNKYFINGRYPFVRVADMGNLQGNKLMSHTRDLINDDGAVKLRLFPKGTILFTKSGASLLLNQRAILNEPMFVVSHIGCLIPNETVISDWLYYWMKTVDFNVYAHATTLPSLKLTTIKELSIPVPPLPEQERIVARIEELFSQLDSGVETLRKTKQQLAVYRQAVLKEAFSSVDGYICAIQDVCKEIKVGIVIKPTQYYVESGGVWAFRNANVRRGYIDDRDWVMISRDGHQQNKKSEVHKGDVLISRSGANLGMASPVSQKYDGYNAIDVVIAVPKADVILPAFLSHYTNSPAGRSIVKTNERGAAQGHLNVSVYGHLPISIPSLEDQRILVARIEDKLSICESIEQTVDTTLQQAEAMRQSILKQAFEGGV